VRPATAQDLARCSAPLEALSLEHAPSHFRERIAQGKPLKIVAIGSSSTSGAGRFLAGGDLSEPPRGGTEGAAARPAGHRC
jgi:hypothetical protein